MMPHSFTGSSLGVVKSRWWVSDRQGGESYVRMIITILKADRKNNP
jgi:hypothetical protein